MAARATPSLHFQLSASAFVLPVYLVAACSLSCHTAAHLTYNWGCIPALQSCPENLQLGMWSLVRTCQ